MCRALIMFLLCLSGVALSQASHAERIKDIGTFQGLRANHVVPRRSGGQLVGLVEGSGCAAARGGRRRGEQDQEQEGHGLAFTYPLMDREDIPSLSV